MVAEGHTWDFKRGVARQNVRVLSGSCALTGDTWTPMASIPLAWGSQVKGAGERVERLDDRLGSATQGCCQCTFRISPTQGAFLEHQMYIQGTRKIARSINRDLPMNAKLSSVTGDHKRARRASQEREMCSPCPGSHMVHICPHAHQETNMTKQPSKAWVRDDSSELEVRRSGVQRPTPRVQSGQKCKGSTRNMESKARLCHRRQSSERATGPASTSPCLCICVCGETRLCISLCSYVSADLPKHSTSLS